MVPDSSTEVGRGPRAVRADRQSVSALLERVAIYGAGGLGCEVLDILQQAGRYAPVLFLDGNPQRHGSIVGGLEVLGGPALVDALPGMGVTRIVVAIGDNAARAAIADTLASRGLELVSTIHPLASVSPAARVADHVIIAARATVCVHAQIGPHAVLSAGAIVEHDNVIGAGAFLGPAVRLGGGVVVEDLARLEIGSSVVPGRRVGRGARVRAGAVVIRDVPAGGDVGGAPARAS